MRKEIFNARLEVQDIIEKLKAIDGKYKSLMDNKSYNTNDDILMDISASITDISLTPLLMQTLNIREELERSK